MDQCTAVTLLPPPEFVLRLAALGDGSRPEAGHLLCELAVGHDGDHAMALWDNDASRTAVWARWSGGRATLSELAWCGAIDPRARTRADCSPATLRPRPGHRRSDARGGGHPPRGGVSASVLREGWLEGRCPSTRSWSAPVPRRSVSKGIRALTRRGNGGRGRAAPASWPRMLPGPTKTPCHPPPESVRQASVPDAPSGPSELPCGLRSRTAPAPATAAPGTGSRPCGTAAGAGRGAAPGRGPRRSCPGRERA